ncbi:large ribosomal subunit protein uL10m-like isoform X2 [Babylonia areolata]|uniref:large ribosomal subunit protein uL10m-like isoform X2 n=1 Tax=Babylonia areolata TaxID=304850 RepID=UPI003FD253AA
MVAYMCLLFLPQFQQVRCRSKVNIQHPKPRHDARRLFEAITRPIIPPEPIPHTEVCARRKAKILESLHEVNPYEEFLLKQCTKMLEENRMVAVCQALPMSAEQRKAAGNKLLKKGLKLCFFSNPLMRQSIDDSVLVNLSPLLISHNLFVVSKEPLIQDLVAILRKIPELILLGGRVDGYLLSREAMLKCAKLPSLDVLRGELVTILGSSASRTHSVLGQHQQTLARNLDQYIKQSQGGEPAVSDSS